MVPRCRDPPSQTPPSAYTISTRSPSRNACWGCALRGTMLPLTSTATRRSTSPVSANRVATVEPSGKVAGAPFKRMSMRHCPIAALQAPRARLERHATCVKPSDHPAAYRSARPPKTTSSGEHMTRKSRFHRSLLAAALALAAAPAFAQETFSQTVFFGDSLTDSGFYQPVLVATNGPQAGTVARFTTNPGLVWAEFLADFYGTNATPAWQLTATGSIVGANGDNYAAGGATIGPGAGFPPSIPTALAPSLTTQINAYLTANGGHADSQALYTVWGGANDLFFHLNGLTSQAQFLGAAGLEVGLVQTLTNAGARYILVPTMPDVGTTPFGLSQGAAGSAGISALVTGYNQTLFGGLAQQNLRVIPLDTYHLLHEIAADPGLYGFTNVTNPACGAAPALGCNPANFAD